MIAAIVGLAGLRVTAAERAVFAAVDPAGYIIFGRNIESPSQLRTLTDELRQLSGRDDMPILIDQEGGRVARLGRPHWPVFPANAAFDALYELAPASAMAAAKSNATAIALTLAAVGITVNCAPLLDLAHPGVTAAIGDRALGRDPMRVAALGRAILSGLHAGGVTGVIKHLPGHGRAGEDSHVGLPIVAASADDLASDLLPFKALREARVGMTAHVVYPAWDAARPATLSPAVIGGVIRGEIGFEGLLISDDIGMAALAGPIAERAGAAIAAGCDLALDCSGDISALPALAEAVGPIGAAAAERLARAVAPFPDAGAGTDRAARLAAAIAHRDALLEIAQS